jgi:hypothetical protein
MVKGRIKWSTATSMRAFSSLLKGMKSIIQAKNVDGFRTMRSDPVIRFTTSCRWDYTGLVFHGLSFAEPRIVGAIRL